MKQITEFDELLLDVLNQTCVEKENLIDNKCISAYEDACDYLTKKKILQKVNDRMYIILDYENNKIKLNERKKERILKRQLRKTKLTLRIKKRNGDYVRGYKEVTKRILIANDRKDDTLISIAFWEVGEYDNYDYIENLEQL